MFDGADTRLLLATASVVALLLVITYGSPVLWLVPLTVVGLADQVAAVAARHAMAAFDVIWDESTTPGEDRRSLSALRAVECRDARAGRPGRT